MQKDNLLKTRLLEAENAERERENENRRESKEFKGVFMKREINLEEGDTRNRSDEQIMNYKEMKLKSFYEEKYRKYIEQKRIGEIRK